VRLGIVQRAQGKAQASAAAFKKAMASPGRDAVVTRLLALAVGGVAPDEARWDEDWPKVRLATGGDEPAIVWPGPNPKGVREAFPSDPVTFDLDDVSLTAFLNCFLGLNRFMEDLESAQEIRRRFPGFENWPLSYKVPATVQKMDFVIHTDVQQYRPDTFAPEAARVSIKATDMPWNDLFENVLASEGLGYVLENNLLMIARAEDLAAFDRVRGRTYAGHRIALRFHDGLPYPGMVPKASSLEERRKDPTARVRFPGLFATAFQDIWGFRFEPDPDLQGRLNLRLMDRPAMEVLDLILASLDAAAVRLPDQGGKTVLRICPLADAGDEALDLSKIEPALDLR
jgi:hypothetical protein